MCIYTDILGNGPELQIQLLTLISIAISIVLWVWAYRKQGIDLKPYVLPIILWIFFGSLDILITAKGTFENPYMEGNQLARLIFIQSGFVGPIVASVLWIALWAGVVLLVNKKFVIQPQSDLTKTQNLAVMFVSLAIFYSLAIGHVFGFSSWFLPFCKVAQTFQPVRNLIGIVFIGCIMAVTHIYAKKFWDTFF